MRIALFRSFVTQCFVQKEPRRECLHRNSLEELRREGRKIRVVGSGHSWTPACETDGYLLNLDHISGLLAIDSQNQTATVKAGTKLKHLNTLLWEKGYALINLGSIAEQSIAGATATATHGTGIGFGNLSSAITALKIIDGEGELREFSLETNPDIFSAFPVSIGCLGIITEFTIKIVRKFYLREERKPMLFEEALQNLPQLLTACDHFKLWWFPYSGMVQTYSVHRSSEEIQLKKKFNLLREDSKAAHAIFGFLLKLGNSRSFVPHINRFISAIQFKTETNTGRSYDIFTMVTPPRHHESEYAIPVEKAAECIVALKQLIEGQRHPVNFVAEIRFVKGDDLWLSPAYKRDVCYVGGYMAGEKGYANYLKAYETLMLSFGGRPHWGKEFSMERQHFEQDYPRWNDFKQLRKQMDSGGLFENEWLGKIFS